MALKKVDILAQMQSELGSPKNLCVVNTEPLFEWIASPQASATDRRVPKFGEFSVKAIKDRKGRNPATGEDAILSALYMVMHRCSGALCWRKVNQKQ